MVARPEGSSKPAAWTIRMTILTGHGQLLPLSSTVATYSGSIGEEKLPSILAGSAFPARRWVVERTSGLAVQVAGRSLVELRQEPRHTTWAWASIGLCPHLAPPPSTPPRYNLTIPLLSHKTQNCDVCFVAPCPAHKIVCNRMDYAGFGHKYYALRWPGRPNSYGPCRQYFDYTNTSR